MTTMSKTKSHPRLTYLHTNNIYVLEINAVYGSNLESVNLAKKLCTNIQVNRLSQNKVK